MSTFVEFLKPTMMPAGGVAGPGENIGFDAATAANFIASGAAAAGSAPGAPTPPAVQRVMLKAFLPVGTPIYNAGVFVGVSPATYDAGDIATFLAPISAALIANGQAISN